MDANLDQKYEDFFNPAIQRPRLLRAAVFIACFEAFRRGLVERGEEFFRGADSDYKTHILDRDKKHKAKATLLWFESMGAIDGDDIKKFEVAVDRRNDLAHELLELLDGGLPKDLDAVFQGMLALLRKIEVWWIRNVEYTGELDSVPDEEIKSGRELVMRVIHDIALGDLEESLAYLNAWKAVQATRRPT